MTSYRLKRRHFLLGLGGMTGLRMLLHNIEAVAVGTRPPPRLLVVHWPGGTVPYAFLPEGTGTTYTTSPILQPFETAGLRNDLIVLSGTRHVVSCPGGGGAEAGVVKMMTGADCPGTRQNGGESDDGVAGGPSFDQIFLEHVPGLRRPVGFVNMTCDARVDSFETSSQCLSYSYATRQVESANPGGLITEHVPQLPDLSPLDTYTKLFEGFAPGMTVDDAARELLLRRSVLDSSLSELGRLRALAPVAEREKLDLHEAAIRQAEVQLSDAMQQPASCLLPTAPDGTLVAPTGNVGYGSNGYGKADVADDERLAQMGRLYFALTRAAFQCDLVRVATFQWCPSTNHVAFQGLYPADPEGAYMHHPLGSRLMNRSALLTHQVSGSDADIVAFLTNVHAWFNQRLAEELVLFKEAEDPFGGNLLDSTVVPNMTEKEDMHDGQSNLPSLILGGRGLGLRGGQFVQFDTRPNHTSVWLSVAQALGLSDPLDALSAEGFTKTDAAPIEGLWEQPL